MESAEAFDAKDKEKINALVVGTLEEPSPGFPQIDGITKHAFRKWLANSGTDALRRLRERLHSMNWMQQGGNNPSVSLIGQLLNA